MPEILIVGEHAQGRLNQVIGAAVSNVAFIAAGLPIWLKQKT